MTKEEFVSYVLTRIDEYVDQAHEHEEVGQFENDTPENRFKDMTYYYAAGFDMVDPNY